MSKPATNRKAAYLNSEVSLESTREERINRLQKELREHVRSIVDYDPLTKNWVRLSDSMQQVANVALMEEYLPQHSANPLDQIGKKKSGTLWDQEKDEMTVRIILEEGKLNLILRLLYRYAVFHRSTEYEAAATKCASEMQCSVESVHRRSLVFEQSLGVLLRFCMAHAECVQILDLSNVFDYCLEIMTKELAREETEEEKSKSVPDIERYPISQVAHFLHLATNYFEEVRIYILIFSLSISLSLYPPLSLHLLFCFLLIILPTNNVFLFAFCIVRTDGRGSHL